MSEMNGKFVNEENHKRIKGKLKKIGIALLCIGAVFTILGITLLIVGFTKIGSSSSGFFDDPQNAIGKTFNSTGLFIGGGFLLVIGLAMLGYGVYATFFAHAREIISYGASTIAPVVGETVNYMAEKVSPSVNKAVGGLAESVAGGISTGIAKGKKQNLRIKCSKCETINSSDSKFCAGCGKQLNISKNCKNCGQKINDGAKFCPNCGVEIKKD